MGPLAFLALTCLLIVGGTQPASANTYTVTSTQCNGTGSLREAIDLANNNPGVDTITFSPPGLTINVSGSRCVVPGGTDYIANVTESVIFQGNGAVIKGNQVFVSSSLAINPYREDICPADPNQRYLLAAISPPFLKVAVAGVEVTIADMSFKALPWFAQFSQGSSLTLDNVWLRAINEVQHCGATSHAGIQVSDGGKLTIKNSHFEQNHNWSWDFGIIFGAFLQGYNNAQLVIDSTLIENSNTKGAINWFGDVTITNSRFVYAGGIALQSGNSEIVNSVFWLSPVRDWSRIIASTTVSPPGSATLDITASTIVAEMNDCSPNCSSYPGAPFYVSSGATVNLYQTAVGVMSPTGIDPTLGGGGSYTADEYTFVKPVTNQDAATLKLLTGQPSLLTGTPALPLDPKILDPVSSIWPEYPVINKYPGIATPLIGPASQPGVLIDAIPNAVCPGGANAVLNPLDGSCITQDVLGNPRWDAGNGKRNIGAIQNVQTPHLTLQGSGDASVDLGWNQPTGSLTGYKIIYHPVGNPSTQEVTIPSPTTLQNQVTGLTNGTQYCFIIHALTPTEGPDSNEVCATPFGPVGIPVVTAIPGVSQVELFWTEPSMGARPGPFSYFVTYRVKGQLEWVNGPGYLSGRITTIPGLTGGIEYEFGVFGQTDDGATPSELGTTTATPIKSCDVNSNGSVNKTDIGLINAARNTPASGASDLRDHNSDGVINLYDSRQCVLLCTKPLCAL
jgi:hypothetical protein